MKRELIVCGNNNLYFGVTDYFMKKCNGIIFDITRDELKDLIKREIYYDLKNIDNNRVNFNYGKKINLCDQDIILYFHPKNKYIIKNNLSDLCNEIKNTRYINLCLEGCVKININFLYDFIKTNILLINIYILLIYG